MNELNLSGTELFDLMLSVLSQDKQTMKIQCLGNSMSPFIRDRNILTIRPFDRNKPVHKGDIVAVAIHDARRILVHRVIDFNEQRVLLKGDGNIENDGWFDIADILGIVQRIETESGVGYTPRHWQNAVIAMGSRFNVIRHMFLPGLKFLKAVR